jgi:hypothetical protein
VNGNNEKLLKQIKLWLIGHGEDPKAVFESFDCKVSFKFKSIVGFDGYRYMTVGSFEEFLQYYYDPNYIKDKVIE